MGLISYQNDEDLKGLIISSMTIHKLSDDFDNEDVNRRIIGPVKKILDVPCDVFDPKCLREYLGIPEWVCMVQDFLSLNLSPREFYKLRIDLFQSIPVGVNLEPVKYKFFNFILNDCIDMINIQDHIENPIKEEIISTIQEMTRIYQECTNLSFWDHEKDSERNERLKKELPLISRILKMSTKGYLMDYQVAELNKIYLKKLFEMLKKEKNILLFKFDDIKQKTNHETKKVHDEYEPLLDHKSPKGFKYLKSLIKRIK